MSLPQNLEPQEPVAEASDFDTPEDASDAQLRLWAKDNSIENVPASGKLSAFWREKITEAMTAALDPKEEDSAETTTPESSTSVETKSAEEAVVEYHSVFQPPNTFVSSQAFTA